MGCCGEKHNKFSTMEFYIDLFTLEPYNGQKSCFIIKKLALSEKAILEIRKKKLLKDRLKLIQ